MAALLDQPASLEDALDRLANTGARPIAGGVGVLLARRLGREIDGRWISIGQLPELRGIDHDQPPGTLVVGAAVTLAELGGSSVARTHAPLLAAAAGVAASAGIRTIATVGGNIHDQPANSDLVAAAMALDASMIARSATGERPIPLRSLASATDLLGKGEMSIALQVPGAGGQGWSLQRLQVQGRGDRPAVTLALQLVAERGVVSAVGAAATFLADRPIDLRGLATALVEVPLEKVASRAVVQRVEGAVLEVVDQAVKSGVSLVDDVRASSTYRRDVTAVLAGRAAIEAAQWSAP